MGRTRKMHDGGKIIAGLVIFLAIVTFPFWYQAARGAEPGPPELAAPTEGKECVAPTEYMKVLHMDLLNVWRDQAVRDGDRFYLGVDGKEYQKSLVGTCIGCHGNRKQFCDRCHAYVGTQPHCWDCHGAH
jgi:hypothetical protein